MKRGEHTMTFYTPKEVAEMLKVSDMTVYAMIKTGKLHFLRFGKQYRIEETELMKQLGETDISSVSDAEEE